MSELTITAAGFVLQPVANLHNGPAILRWAYNRSFLDSNGIQVFAGTQNSGFGVEIACSIADGLISVDEDSLLWTTDNAQDLSPASIWISAWLLTPRRVLIAPLTVIGKTQLVVTESLTPSCTWEQFSNYNQAVNIGNAPDFWYTAAEVNRLIDQSFDLHPASDTELGTVLLTVPADIPASPVVWGANDPLVRDAIKIQGVDVGVTAPLDTQTLVFNQAINRYEPANQATGTGNVISNEVSSVDSEIALFSGTGGKTIKRGAFSGILKALSGVVSAAVAAVDYVAPGLITASGLTQTTGKLLGRSTASTGAVEEISVGTGLSLSAGVLSNTVTDSGITQLTGDVTAGPGSGSQAATIPNDTVTFAKIQNIATDSLIGRDTAGSGDSENILLNATLSMDGANNLQRAALTGDVTAPAGSNATTIASHAVTYAKMQQVSAISTLLGRGDSGAPGDVQELILGAGLSITGTTISSSGSGGTVSVSGSPVAGNLTKFSGGSTITNADLTGDVTTAGGVATTLANIPTATPAAGQIVFTDIAAPTAPAAAHLAIFGDSTDLRFHDKNAAGTIGTTVVADTGTSNNFLTAISAAGVISKAQPSISNISGMGSNVATFLTTPSSANLAAALTDETGSGASVFATSPTITTPIITSPQTSLTAAHGSDDTYTGITIVGLNAGATIAQWEAVYLDGSSTWQLADANGSSTYPARGLAVAAYVSTNPATILTYGTVRNDAWNWTPGGAIYLSGTVGALTQTAPSASGDKVQQVGFALTADIAFFDMNSTYLTVT